MAFFVQEGGGLGVGWTRIDDAFLEDETILSLRHTTYRVHVSGIIYCSRNLTDGIVTDRAAKVIQAILGFNVRRAVAELEEAGLWVPVESGHRIKNYLKYNPSAEKVKEMRARNAERQQRHRDRGHNESNGLSNGVTAHVSNDAPSRPGPARGVSDLSALPREAGHDENLWKRLCVAAGARTPQDIVKLERAVRSRGSTAREIVCAIEAATGPGVRDPLAVALSELVKRHAERDVLADGSVVSEMRGAA